MTLHEWCGQSHLDPDMRTEGGAFVISCKYDNPWRQFLHHLSDAVVVALTEWTVWVRPYTIGTLPPSETSGGYAVNGWGMPR